MKIKLLAALALAALLLLPACGTVGQLSEEEKAQIAKNVDKKLDNRSFEIEVNYMSPLRGPGKSLSDSYSVSVDGDKFISRLPYVGNATAVPYGGGVGLNFDETIQEYKDEGWKKDNRIITVSVKNTEDAYVYTLTVYDNGNAYVNVSCRNRDSISFSGTLRLE